MNGNKPHEARKNRLSLNRATIKRLRAVAPGAAPPRPATANSPQCPNPD